VAELVYPPVIVAAKTAFRALGIRFVIEGVEHIPRSGGAVLASNHVSYLDFTFCGFAALPAGRLVRFMAKDAVFRFPLVGPLMRGMHHIAVDRTAGAQAYSDAVAALRAGEIVGLFPEATISRSFTVKHIKTGAARMAMAAGVPIVPMATWGGQRIFTKGRRPSWHRGQTIALTVGPPLVAAPGEDAAALTDRLRDRLVELIECTQRTHPDAAASDGEAWWLPAYLGGSAPTPAEATALDASDAAGRPRRRGGRQG
jgi:1-acyl-sn-glycerol-3-phosphate acyltransferase